MVLTVIELCPLYLPLTNGLFEYEVPDSVFVFQCASQSNSVERSVMFSLDLCWHLIHSDDRHKFNYGSQGMAQHSTAQCMYMCRRLNVGKERYLGT